MALIPNNGWETGDAGGWTLTGGGGSGSASVQELAPMSGRYHLRLVSQSGFGSSGGSYTFANGASLIGYTVRFRVWIKWNSGAGDRGGNLQILDGVGNTTEVWTYSASYAQITVSRIIQAGTTTIQFSINHSGSGGGQHDIDNMEVEVQDAGGNIVFASDLGLVGKASYGVEVDWDNDGTWGESGEGITAYAKPLTTDRGRDSELESMVSGTLELILDNNDGRFSPENTASPLSPNVLPGRPVRVRAIDPSTGTIYNLFKGFIEAIIPHPEPEAKDCYLLCVDGMDRLSRVKIDAPSGGAFTDVKIGADPGPMETILDEAGWPVADRTLDVGIDTLDVWWAHRENALDATRKLMDGEKSLAYIDEAGKFVYEDRHHRLKDGLGGATDHLTSQATFSDTMTKMDYGFSARTVRNRAAVTGHKRVAKASAYLWGTQDRPRVPANGTLTVWAVFAEPVSGITASAATTDWRANTASDSSGTNLTTSVSIVSTLYGQSVKMVITNAATQDVYMVPGTSDPNDTLRIRATAYDEDNIVGQSEDTASQTAYGDRSIDVDVPFAGSFTFVQSYADWLVSRLKDAQADTVRMHLVNSSAALLTQILSRKISDRITITATALGISAKAYYINRIKHQIDEGFTRHRCEFTLERVDETKYWLLQIANYGELEQTTRIGF